MEEMLSELGGSIESLEKALGERAFQPDRVRTNARIFVSSYFFIESLYYTISRGLRAQGMVLRRKF